MKIRAVLFDLGGVVVDSPLEALASYEIDNRITPGSINRLIAAAGEAGVSDRGFIQWKPRGEVSEVEALCTSILQLLRQSKGLTEMAIGFRILTKPAVGVSQIA